MHCLIHGKQNTRYFVNDEKAFPNHSLKLVLYLIKNKNLPKPGFGQMHTYMPSAVRGLIPNDIFNYYSYP